MRSSLPAYGGQRLGTDSKQGERTDKRRLVLVVEDNPSVAAMFVRVLSSVDCTVLTATSLAQALAAAARKRPHVIVLDLRLPDSGELETLDAILGHHNSSRVIVVSGFSTTALTVQAMKKGAFHVFEKPVKVDPFLSVVRDALATDVAYPARHSSQAGDAVSRLVEHFGRTLTANRDLKTLGAWADHIGVSVTMLRQACYLAHVPPHDARDFVRVLVAVVRAQKMGCDLDLLFDIADSRTLHALLIKAGLAGRTANASVGEFLARQQFVPTGHEVLRLLREALKR